MRIGKFNLSSKWLLISLVSLLLILWLTAWWFSEEPDTFSVKQRVQTQAEQLNLEPVNGFATATAAIEVLDTLLNKRGGYMSNDILPPFAWVDDIPAWEYGVVQMSRDLMLVMRNEYSRSQSQSAENSFLVVAQPAMNIDHTSWFAPSPESEFSEVIKQLKQYRLALADPNDHSAQFYSRSDNLRVWVAEVEKRLGSLSRRLSASVARVEPDVTLAGDAKARQSTPTPQIVREQTSWWEIDDVFYEARGASWALLHFLKAVEIDFNDILKDKNALISLQQIISELESTQKTLWSPMVLNGSGFGLMANHSLVMANYISRANAALIELRSLLAQG